MPPANKLPTYAPSATGRPIRHAGGHSAGEAISDPRKRTELTVAPKHCSDVVVLLGKLRRIAGDIVLRSLCLLELAKTPK